MTIKRRINLSFLVIIVLFCANLAFYFWNSHSQRISADSLKRATRRQLLLSDIEQEITGFQRQISLLSQAISDTSGGAGAAQLSQFKEQLHKTSVQIHELEQLADTDMR